MSWSIGAAGHPEGVKDAIEQQDVYEQPTGIAAKAFAAAVCDSIPEGQRDKVCLKIEASGHDSGTSDLPFSTCQLTVDIREFKQKPANKLPHGSGAARNTGSAGSAQTGMDAAAPTDKAEEDNKPAGEVKLR